MGILSGTSLGSWLEANPTDDEFCRCLVRPIQWELDSISADELVIQLRDQAGQFYQSRNLPVMAASQAVRSLTDLVFETAAKPNVQHRKLTPLDSIRVMEESAAALLLAQTSSPMRQSPLDTAQSGLVSLVGGLSQLIAQRPATVTDVLAKTAGQPLIWIHGSNGVGKSTFARLCALKLGGRWIELDLQPVQKTSSGSLAAWRELSQWLAIGEPIEGVIINDFDFDAASALRTRLSAIVRMLAPRGIRTIVTSHYEPNGGFLTECGASASVKIPAPYFTEVDITELIRLSPAPPEDMQTAWSTFIGISTGGGHPLLVSAKISNLRARSWPTDALVEDVAGSTSDAIRVTREEARRTLLKDLAELDQSRSLDAGNLLRRIGCVFDRVEDGLIYELASATPGLQNAGDALALLRGTWLEALPAGDLRISPLLADIPSDVPINQARDWRCVAAEYWLKKRTLDQRTLPLCFWNAFWGQHSGVLMELCVVIQTMPKEQLRGAAALLSPLVALPTSVPITSSNPAVAAQLRLLQFEVANALQEGVLAADIARCLLREVNEIEHSDLKAMIVHISTSKILTADFAEIPASERISHALALRASEPIAITLAAGKIPHPSTLFPSQLAAGTDTADVLFSSIVQHIESSKDALNAIEALDGIASADRNRFLDTMSSIYEGVSVFIHSGWARDQSEGRDMDIALNIYEQIEFIVGSWNRLDVKIETTCARSVILDECLGRLDEAVSVMDQGISIHGAAASLVRQKSKVLGHAGREGSSNSYSAHRRRSRGQFSV
jgi:hypothetical protein